MDRDACSLSKEAQEDVLRIDVVVPELQRLAKRKLHDSLRTRGERRLAARPLPSP